nr:MAG TPA: hypothetical protein [Caudoviricetes sp.]
MLWVQFLPDAPISRHSSELESSPALLAAGVYPAPLDVTTLTRCNAPRHVVAVKPSRPDGSRICKRLFLYFNEKL